MTRARRLARHFGLAGETGLFILGLLLGLDLLFTGVMWIGFGLRLREPCVISASRKGRGDG